MGATPAPLPPMPAGSIGKISFTCQDRGWLYHNGILIALAPNPSFAISVDTVVRTGDSIVIKSWASSSNTAYPAGCNIVVMFENEQGQEERAVSRGSEYWRVKDLTEMEASDPSSFASSEVDYCKWDFASWSPKNARRPLMGALPIWSHSQASSSQYVAIRAKMGEWNGGCDWDNNKIGQIKMSCDSEGWLFLDGVQLANTTDSEVKTVDAAVHAGALVVVLGRNTRESNRGGCSVSVTYSDGLRAKVWKSIASSDWRAKVLSKEEADDWAVFARESVENSCTWAAAERATSGTSAPLSGNGTYAIAPAEAISVGGYYALAVRPGYRNFDCAPDF